MQWRFDTRRLCLRKSDKVEYHFDRSDILVIYYGCQLKLTVETKHENTYQGLPRNRYSMFSGHRTCAFGRIVVMLLVKLELVTLSGGRVFLML